MNITLRNCEAADLPELLALARQTFEDAFRAENPAEEFEAYLAQAFTPEKFTAEMHNPESVFTLLYVEGSLAGYIKLNWGAAQSDPHYPEALEIERIYVRREFQGQGLGRALVRHALGAARKLGKPQVWLGVWEKNANAIAFYRRMGFEVLGEHDFWIGTDRQTDYVMGRVV